MSDNKYKNKINKEKEKCENIIKKLYGDIYYFLHGTTETSIEDILKSGKIKIGTHTGDRNFTHKSYLSLPYAYCNIEFDDVPIKYMRPLFPFILLIHPKILFYHNIIFNNSWSRNPDTDSIYINKKDTFNNKKQKINDIKNSLIKIKSKESYFYQNDHEILFTKDINLKDNLIGIICCNYNYYPAKQIIKLLEKYGYDNIKIYDDINEFPLLCDLLL